MTDYLMRGLAFVLGWLVCGLLYPALEVWTAIIGAFLAAGWIVWSFWVVWREGGRQ